MTAKPDFKPRTVNTVTDESYGPMRRKTVRRWEYDANSGIQVWVSEVTPMHNYGQRWIDVWTAKGTYLGRIEGIEGQTQRHLYGNVADFGVPRTFWGVEGQYIGTGYGYESQSDAIRTLIEDRIRKVRAAKAKRAGK